MVLMFQQKIDALLSAGKKVKSKFGWQQCQTGCLLDLRVFHVRHGVDRPNVLRRVIQSNASVFFGHPEVSDLLISHAKFAMEVAERKERT